MTSQIKHRWGTLHVSANPIREIRVDRGSLTADSWSAAGEVETTPAVCCGRGAVQMRAP